MQTSFFSPPFLIALLITSMVHLLLLPYLKIHAPTPEKKQQSVIITLMKPQPKPQPVAEVPIAAIPATPAINPLPPAVVVAESPKPVSYLSKPVVKIQKPKKFYRPVATITETATIKPANSVTASTSAIAATEIHATAVEAAPVVVHPTTPEPPAKQNPVVPITPTPPVPVVAPEPVAKPKVEPEPIIAATPSPAPVVKAVETQPVPAAVVQKPVEVAKPIVQTPLPTVEVAHKTTDLPIVASQKSPSSASAKNTASTTDTPPALSMDDLALQIAQVGEKFANQAPINSEETPAKPSHATHAVKKLMKQYQSTAWHKIEKMSKLNSPEAAGQPDSVKIKLVINADGSIKSSKFSGDTTAAEVARNIVQMSAPFMPFPEELAQEIPSITVSGNLHLIDE